MQGPTNRRSFLFSLLTLLGTGIFGLNGCQRRSAKDGKPAESVIMPRNEPLPSLGWAPFLHQWSDEILALLKSDPTFASSPMPREALQAGYLGFGPAAEEEIVAAEKRLGLTLPPSYKNFLRVSNGWRQIGMDAEDGLLYPVSQVGWFRDLQPTTLKAWLSGSGGREASDQDYFVYGERQDPVNLRDSYLPECLAISSWIDSAIYLLNPKVVDAAGEWEAWFFGNALPGANRYRSFQEMMVAERQRVMQSIKMAIAYRRNQPPR